MINNFGVNITKAGLLVFISLFQTIAYIAIIVIVLYFIPATNRAIENTPKPSTECFITYAKTGGQGADVSPACRQTVDNYYDNDALNNQQAVIKLLVGLFVLGILSILPYVRWFNSYAAGVAKATAGTITQTGAMALLLLCPPTIGMAIIQDAFNKKSLVAAD